jgi:Fe2+ or Zn2+ uptake regulation protein
MVRGLREAGLKVTPQRMAIVEAFADDPTHPTAQAIFERLHTLMPTMSFATVYSTLDTLAAAGLCSVRALSPGPARFDPHVEAHDHALCTGCGAMLDLPSHSANQSNSIGIPGFQVQTVETIYRGLCAPCSVRIPGSENAIHGEKKQNQRARK